MIKLLHENQILQGDALTRLKDLHSESIDCIITSPPYWALRDYKTDGQIGVEKTIDEYISNLIAVFDECKRVLKKSGTCWVVLGDTYSSNGVNRNGLSTGTCSKRVAENKQYPQRENLELPEKSLCMIPERFAIKMIDNGWILRNKIIWHKRNCMPSSAKDRFTIDYEYVYFFTKSKKYYFKTQYEPLNWDTEARYKRSTFGGGAKQFNGNPTYMTTPKTIEINPNGRIKRCVWTINTKPFSEAHFAVFPEELVKQCLDAGCPPSPDGIVLDPFMGAGTTALVALKNNRKFVGIELNKEYVEIANKRLQPYLYQTKLFIV
jgi:site-specific DNA-methyltransferase (adenine-specific)